MMKVVCASLLVAGLCLAGGYYYWDRAEDGEQDVAASVQWPARFAAPEDEMVRARNRADLAEQAIAAVEKKRVEGKRRVHDRMEAASEHFASADERLEGTKRRAKSRIRAAARHFAGED